MAEANEFFEITLKDILALEGVADKRNIILKVDIEGDEWSVFDAVPMESLSRVSQLIVELHNFQNAWQSEWCAKALNVLRRLRTVFTPIHLHGNNCAGFCQIGGSAFPCVLEITYVRTSDHSFGEPIRSAPNTELDVPNNPDFADLRFQI